MGWNRSQSAIRGESCSVAGRILDPHLHDVDHSLGEAGLAVAEIHAPEAVERFEAVALKADGDGGKIHRLEDNAPPPARDRSVSSSRYRKSYEDNGPKAEAAPAPAYKMKFNPKPHAAPAGDAPKAAWRAEAPDGAPPKPKFKPRPAAGPESPAPWRPEGADAAPAPWKKKKKFKARKAN